MDGQGRRDNPPAIDRRQSEGRFFSVDLPFSDLPRWWPVSSQTGYSLRRGTCWTLSTRRRVAIAVRLPTRGLLRNLTHGVKARGSPSRNANAPLKISNKTPNDSIKSKHPYSHCRNRKFRGRVLHRRDRANLRAVSGSGRRRPVLGRRLSGGGSFRCRLETDRLGQMVVVSEVMPGV